MSSKCPFRLEQTINVNGDKPPFGYYSPASGATVIWMCNYDENKVLTSVFCSNWKTPKEEKQSTFVKDINVPGNTDEEKAVYIRDELVRDGWVPMQMPKINFSMSDK